MNDKHDVEIQQQTEIALHVPNDLDALAKLFAALAAQQPSIVAWWCCSKHERTTVLVVTRHKIRTARVLRAAGFECETKPVIVVGQQPPGLSTAQLSAGLRAVGIEILDAYTGGVPHNGTMSVLSTTNNPRAAEILAALDQSRGPETATTQPKGEVA